MATTAAAAEKRDRTKERSLLNFPGKSFCFHVLYAACKTVRLKDSDKLSWSVYEFTEAVSNLSKIAILLFFGGFFLGGGGGSVIFAFNFIAMRYCYCCNPCFVMKIHTAMKKLSLGH